MLNLIDKYLEKCMNSFDNFMMKILEEDHFAKRTYAAYTIQIAYRKHLVRKYLKLKQEVVKDEDVWHMNIVN